MKLPTHPIPTTTGPNTMMRADRSISPMSRTPTYSLAIKRVAVTIIWMIAVTSPTMLPETATRRFVVRLRSRT